ncbi:hypothetical protein CEUSTIGMA_g10170.t1 [Chlamydomonas eustigma]|uniref:Phospholipase B-like n=1 Tax=Chlamydomonas eustigma TaxID=1157962 RepID=A0A250XI37_9CHLO|nr:hypothetical protein CEUSTIGMA_g10170.t1 [Chlamydomonas eustigma]|eukprot:GAX82744.1 hypothetical protein CEUSTIGMA_g10170.t1 [Chlamydomonas eustigma]
MRQQIFALLIWLHNAHCFQTSTTTNNIQSVSDPLGQKGCVVHFRQSNKLSFAALTNSPDCVAYGSFSSWESQPSYFAQLRVSLYDTGAFDDQLKMRAAGYLEGYLSAESLSDHAYNVRSWLQSNRNGAKNVIKWLVMQDAWIRDHVQQVRKSSPTGDESHTASGSRSGNDIEKRQSEARYWEAISLVLSQLDGILEGYNSRRHAEAGNGFHFEEVTKEDLLIINALGDLGDLLPMFNETTMKVTTRDLTKLSPIEAWHALATSGHCSVLVKVKGDLTDLFVGHVTWTDYYAMVRIYKHYNFSGLQYKHALNKLISMSSYPGAVSSIDDFYIIGAPSHLVVTETTNPVLDERLFGLVTHRAPISYHRVFAANLLSSSGEEWVEWAQMYPSGTYNNQYMVIDLKRFSPGEELKPGLLMVLELMPGLAKYGDLTHELEHGYFPSYNIPYFKDIYKWSGFLAVTDKLTSYGAEYSKVVRGLNYQLTPRAKIFRRDAGAIDDLEALKRVLRSNSWGPDNYTNNEVFGTICARGDLDPVNPTPYGCLDAKVTSYSMAMAMRADAVSGPSREHGLPAFSWSKAASFATGSHRGMPDVFDGRFDLQEP